MGWLLTRGWLPQTAWSPSLNGHGNAAAVPPTIQGRFIYRVNCCSVLMKTGIGLEIFSKGARRCADGDELRKTIPCTRSRDMFMYTWCSSKVTMNRGWGYHFQFAGRLLRYSSLGSLVYATIWRRFGVTCYSLCVNKAKPRWCWRKAGREARPWGQRLPTTQWNDWSSSAWAWRAWTRPSLRDCCPRRPAGLGPGRPTSGQQTLPTTTSCPYHWSSSSCLILPWSSPSLSRSVGHFLMLRKNHTLQSWQYAVVVSNVLQHGTVHVKPLDHRIS